MDNQLSLQLASVDDFRELDAIREDAFEPIFDSFKRILGSTIYENAQRHEDEQQKYLLADMLQYNDWKVFKATDQTNIMGFCSIRFYNAGLCAELGLNAVSPEFQNRGVAQYMYGELERIAREQGVNVLTVATGGDPAHANAVMAYQRAGFDVSIPSIWLCKDLTR